MNAAKCSDPECWCCGTPHICDLPRPATTIGTQHTCPDCGSVSVVMRYEDSGLPPHRKMDPEMLIWKTVRQ